MYKTSIIHGFQSLSHSSQAQCSPSSSQSIEWHWHNNGLRDAQCISHRRHKKSLRTPQEFSIWGSCHWIWQLRGEYTRQATKLLTLVHECWIAHIGSVHLFAAERYAIKATQELEYSAHYPILGIMVTREQIITVDPAYTPSNPSIKRLDELQDRGV